MPRSIWFVVDVDEEQRGAIPTIAALADRLRLEDVSVTMVFSAAPSEDRVRALAQAGVDVRILDFRSARAPLALLLWFQEYRPDIVHFHFRDPHPSFVAAAKISGACTVVQDGSVPRAEGALRRARTILLDRFVDVRVEGIHAAVPLGGYPGREGSAVRAELGVSDAPLVVSAGRLDPEGGETVLQAMVLLERDVHLAIVEEAPYEMAPRSLAGKLGIAGRVHFLRGRDDVAEILAAADVVVVASDRDSQAAGLAAIEGMAASRPVIVIRSGELPGIVGDAGIVVPNRDPASLGLAIRTVLSDPERGDRLGKLGRSRVEELYSLDAYLDRLLKQYRKIFLRSEPRTEPSRILQVA